MFKVGSKVTWSSQSHGSRTTKVGTIVAVVPPGRSPSRAFADVKETLNARSAFGGGMARDHESYLVSVTVGKTDKAKPALYWPLVSQLRRVEE